MGRYTFANLPSGGTYTITPSSTAFTFAPPARALTNVVADASGLDFVASAVVHTISGQVRDLNDTGVPGITLQLTGGATATTTSDADGRYAFTVPDGLTFTVTPSRPAFVFTPPSQTFTNVREDRTASFFIASPGVFTRYFAEGATGSFFDTTIALLNATGAADRCDRSLPALRRPGDHGPAIARPAGSRHDRSRDAAGARRRVVLDGRRIDAAAHRRSDDALGSVRLRIPCRDEHCDAADALVSRRRRDHRRLQPVLPDAERRPARPRRSRSATCCLAPAAPVVRTYTVGANTRRTIYVNGEGSGLDETDVSAVVTSTNGVPIIVERAMYLDSNAQLFGAGHDSAAIPEPSLTWLFAEGATGPFFNMYLLIANPERSAARGVGPLSAAER